RARALTLWTCCQPRNFSSWTWVSAKTHSMSPTPPAPSPLGQFWITGGAALPTGRTAIENAINRLNKQRLLVDGKFTDPHKATLVFVRTLLEDGASQH